MEAVKRVLGRREDGCAKQGQGEVFAVTEGERRATNRYLRYGPKFGFEKLKTREVASSPVPASKLSCISSAVTVSLSVYVSLRR